MTSFKYNQASNNDIKKLFNACAFNPPLDTYIADVDEYIKKIATHSERIEIWNDHSELVGLLACYINDTETKKAFITMISISQKYTGRGLGKDLLNEIISICRRKNYNNLDLEVNHKNTGAVHLYEKYGFKTISTNGNTHLMRVNLKG